MEGGVCQGQGWVWGLSACGQIGGILDSARDATEHMDSPATGDPVGASVGGGLEVTPSKSAQPCAGAPPCDGGHRFCVETGQCVTG